MYRIKITDNKTGSFFARSPKEVKDYINNEYPGLYPDLDGIIKAILNGATIKAPHDTFERVKLGNDDEAS